MLSLNSKIRIEKLKIEREDYGPIFHQDFKYFDYDSKSCRYRSRYMITTETERGKLMEYEFLEPEITSTLKNERDKITINGRVYMLELENELIVSYPDYIPELKEAYEKGFELVSNTFNKDYTNITHFMNDLERVTYNPVLENYYVKYHTGDGCIRFYIQSSGYISHNLYNICNVYC
jgi:hypothetical protein